MELRTEVKRAHIRSQPKAMMPFMYGCHCSFEDIYTLFLIFLNSGREIWQTKQHCQTRFATKDPLGAHPLKTLQVSWTSFYWRWSYKTQT